MMLQSAPGRTRTADAGLRTASLCPLSYGGADPIVPRATNRAVIVKSVAAGQIRRGGMDRPRRDGSVAAGRIGFVLLPSVHLVHLRRRSGHGRGLERHASLVRTLETIGA